jgi:hypothetical protein
MSLANLKTSLILKLLSPALDKFLTIDFSGALGQKLAFKNQAW